MSGSLHVHLFNYVFRLLGQVVDHLDALIDEWYPGLTSVDPLQGRHLLEKYAPCVYCEGSYFLIMLHLIAFSFHDEGFYVGLDHLSGLVVEFLSREQEVLGLNSCIFDVTYFLIHLM